MKDVPVCRGEAEAPPLAHRPPLPLALDRAYLARQTLGDVDLECELLRAFRSQAETVLRRLRGGRALTTRERADLAHLLKGSARAIGAIRVGSACEIYEADLADCGRAGAPSDDAAAENALSGLAAAVAETTDAIDQSLAERAP